MALWPFRKRRKKTTEGKKAIIIKTDLHLERKHTNSRNSSRLNTQLRNISQSSFNGDQEISVVFPNEPLSSPPLPPTGQLDFPTDEFHPQKQTHQNGFSSYFTEQRHGVCESSSSLQCPHKPLHLLRRSAKRKNDQSSQSVYNTTIKGHDSRWNGHFAVCENERAKSVSSAIPRHSFNSMESQLSERAFKVRGFGVFAPRPTLRYTDRSSATLMPSTNFSGPGLVPSRSNSRRTASQAIQDWRYKGILIPEQNLVTGTGRVDELVDELDSHGLREAMDRDQRRRAKKQQDEEVRAQRKLERKAYEQRRNDEQAREQQYAESQQHTHSLEMPKIPDLKGRADSRIQDELVIRCTKSNPYQYRDAISHPHAPVGTQTPLSWFNGNQSLEDVNGELPQFSPRLDVVTPVSMDSGEYSNQNDQAKDIVFYDTTGVQEISDVDTQSKAPAWTSYIKRATAARIRKDHEFRVIKKGDSTLVSDSEGEEDPAQYEQSPQYLASTDLRHKEGRTPGRHVPYEVSLAMNAVETGHIQDKEYKDGLRDRVLTTPSLTYHHNGSQTSPKSSFEHHVEKGLPQPAVLIQSTSIPDSNARPRSQLPYHPKPPSIQRYSPSNHRHSSGAASPENAPRSIMSTSLASIDSEGSWLSGKIISRHSIQHISPLRTSASSLRKRYHELDDQVSHHEDDYFSGVKQKLSQGFSADNEVGGAKLDLDTDDSGSIQTDDERNMWRGAVEKRVVINDPPRHLRAMSTEGMLNDFDDVEQVVEFNRAIKSADIAGSRSPSPTFGSSDFETPLEHPYARPISSGFRTPLEQPAKQQSWMKVE